MDTLERFIEAQDPVYDAVIAELTRGKKQSHWMWFVFPQPRGLGRSDASRYYGIASRAEALAYSRHAVLGARLRECTALVLAIQGRSAHDIFGTPDDLKFHSCMTLFHEVDPEEPSFARALERYFAGAPDVNTLDRLTREGRTTG